MKRLMAIATGSTIAISAMAGDTEAMAGYRWKARPVVVFSAGEDAAELSKQRKLIASARAALAERDVVVIYVVGDTVRAELGAAPKSSASALRSRFGIGAGAFRAILIGKDGGTKISSASALSPSTLIRTIDAMPMRQQEMRR